MSTMSTLKSPVRNAVAIHRSAATRQAVTALAALLAATVLSACGNGKADVQPATQPLRPVRIAAVESGPALPPVVANGTIAAHDEVKVSFKMGGVIRSIAVREGDTVTEGQQLAELEQTEVAGVVTQAREAHAKARRDLERGRKLAAQDVITREQLEDLQTAEAMARAQLSTAEFNRGYSAIVSPGPGRVLWRLAQERELVGPGQPVLVIGDLSHGYVLQAGLSDRSFVNVRTGDAASVTLDAFPGRRLTGRVTEVARAADPKTGTFHVEVALDPTDVALATGLIGRVEIAAGGSASPAVAPAQRSYLPVTSLVEGSQDSVLVFLLEGDTVRSRQVAVAFLAGDRVALAEPLAPGAQVVTQGASFLHDGERVRVVE